MNFSKSGRFTALSALVSVCLALALDVRAQSNPNPSGQVPSSSAALRGLAIPDIGSVGPRYFSGLPGTHINSLAFDNIPYVSDFSLVEDEYIVGSGDVFQLHFEANSLEKQVSPEGTITLNRIGVVALEGLTLRKAKEKLLEKLSTAYRRSECYVGLSRPKYMRVFVTGAVNNPGPHDLPGNFRVVDAIRSAGGFSATAQKGDIVVNNGEGVENIRLDRFIVEGDLSANPYLQQGAVIHVPFIDYEKPWVTVRRDGVSLIVQLDSGQSAAEVVATSYAFAASAHYLALLVKEKDGRDTLLTAADSRDYTPANGAYVEVIPARQEIFVAGAVAAPGLQPHVSSRKVIQYISTAGLLTSSKVPRKIEVIRASGNRVTVPIESSDVMPGDVLFVRQNAEQKFLIYTPILLSFVSLSLAVITVFGINQ